MSDYKREELYIITVSLAAAVLINAVIFTSVNDYGSSGGFLAFCGLVASWFIVKGAFMIANDQPIDPNSDDPTFRIRSETTEKRTKE